MALLRAEVGLAVHLGGDRERTCPSASTARSDASASQVLVAGSVVGTTDVFRPWFWVRDREVEPGDGWSNRSLHHRAPRCGRCGARVASFGVEDPVRGRRARGRAVSRVDSVSRWRGDRRSGLRRRGYRRAGGERDCRRRSPDLAQWRRALGIVGHRSGIERQARMRRRSPGRQRSYFQPTPALPGEPLAVNQTERVLRRRSQHRAGWR